MLRLLRFKVSNFRSVIDSNWVTCDDVTTLVGVNESGKTNILLALWKLNPASGGKIDILHDMPVSRLSELRKKAEQVCFIEAMFSLNDSVSFFKSHFGSDFSEDDEICIKRHFDGHYSWNLIDTSKQSTIDELTVSRATDDGQPIAAKYSTSDIESMIISQLPSFVYYSNYGNLASKVYLPFAVKWLKGEAVPGIQISEDQVRTLRVLFKYVNLEPDEILRLGEDASEMARKAGRQGSINKADIEKSDENKEQRALLLQSASTKLTKDFKEWWKQGNYVFKFDTDGDYFRIWVSDEIRADSVSLELRSTGLQWFLSFFLIFLVECQEDKKNAILLLDEAGLTLHPLAQKDLALFFTKIAENNPIINTTHSPFIVDTDHIDRCRVVYTDEKGGTIVSENLREGAKDVGNRSIYAVHAALGLSVSDVLLQGCQVVIVEGVSDQFYLSTIKTILIREKKIAPKKDIVFAPAGGVKGISGIIGLVSAKNDDLPYVILDSDSIGKDYKKKIESNLYIGHNERIICINSVVKMDGSEVEDLIPFSIIEKRIRILFGTEIGDEFEEEFERDSSKPIIPQIETFAEEHSVILKEGWKVDISRFFNKKMLSSSLDNIPETCLSMWVELFKMIMN